ncbi:MAG: hypothetical protein A2782_02865 [Candidatus Blackburnbacteria bacterium RIFCSPHIGHO2_01_FULL_43_15b]|uniref:Glycosyltransferase RgtA/B/C/D-like domain-containing protein n=1 Tax=Candidatus Blackburnbacteria bacterium RIFCSPHIGHO2_01_FULL_43_15b TaxID=1797513 RepID=A0A1G1V315_9BACT|nr:MAG: hypothetical protein A2782_02865 [Candidatus Blackburnbacteria bacterium RIFCSPHIGHO2_01_FULL_43_15b]
MKSIWKIIFIAFVLRLAFSFVTWHPDLNNHVDWGIRFWEYGPAKFYKANVWSFTWPNQPPGTIYIFAGIRKLFELTFSFFWYLNVSIPAFPSNLMLFFEKNLYQALLKLPAILSDCGIAYLIFRVFAKQGKKTLGLCGATLFLANPIVWYNSTIWGQTDSIISFFALLAFVLLIERKFFFAFFAIMLSLYIKLSLIIFLPVFFVVALKQKYALKQWVIALLAPILIISVLTIPFSQKAEPFGWLITLYKDKVFTQQLQVITANAFNLWAAVAGIHEKPQTLLLGPLQYAQWGELLLGIAYLPAIYLVWRKQEIKSVMWSLSIIAFSSFMLATNMHERYLYPLFAPLTILVCLYSFLLPLYIIVSLVSLVNLYNFWWFPKIDFIVQIMSVKDRIAPRILGLINFGFFLYFYKQFYTRNFRKG